MYISSLGSSPRVTSTGKVFVSLTPNSTPRSAAEPLQALHHGDGVRPLQVLVEVVRVERDVAEAEGVERLARVLVAQKRRVALDVGVQALLADEVGRDALDLCGRAAVERGLGDGVADVRRDGVDKRGVHVAEAVDVRVRPGDGLLELRRRGRVLHAVDERVDLRGLDALEVVADGHVEHEAVRVAKAKLAREQLARDPCLDVLAKRLRHGELRGPLAVVALVGREDARLVDAGGKLGAVHLLDGLQLEEAGTRHVARDDVLGELGVGTGCRAKRGLDLLAKDGTGRRQLRAGKAALAEDGLLGLVLVQDPRHEVVEGHGAHDVAHSAASSPKVPSRARAYGSRT
jgi:hypothetical protein